MWNNLVIFGCLATAAFLPNSYGVGYSQLTPDNPLVLPSDTSIIDSSISGYQKKVPAIPFQVPSGSETDADRLPFGANDDNVSTLPKRNQNHGSDGKYDHADDGTGWDIRKSVPGEPGRDYPVYSSVPTTSFTCADKIPGYYADLETRCQVFRVCTTGSVGAFNSFLCPNGSLFNQAVHTCDWWRSVDCDASINYYYKNNEIRHMPEGAELMYKIQKMLDAPKLSEAYEYNALDSQVQETETHDDFYLPPVQLSSTTRKYYTPTIPLTTSRPAYDTSTVAYRPPVEVESQTAEQQSTIVPPSTDYLPPKYDGTTEQPQYVLPGVYTSQQRPAEDTQVGVIRPAQQHLPNSNSNELHLSPELQTTPPLLVSNIPSTLKVSSFIKAKIPQPLRVSDLESPMELFTSKPVIPQALNLPQSSVPSIPHTMHNAHLFLSQIGQQNKTNVPSITITKEQSHSISKTQGTSITQTVGQGPDKVSLLNVEQPTDLPIQTGKIDLNSFIPNTETNKIPTKSVPSVALEQQHDSKIVPGTVTTITKEDAFKSIDSIRTQIQQIIPHAEVAEEDLKNIVSSTQSSPTQDVTVAQEPVSSSGNIPSIGPIVHPEIIQQTNFKDTGDVQNNVSQGNKVQDDISHQTLLKEISEQDSSLKTIAQDNTGQYFGEGKIDIRFKNQKNPDQSNFGHEFGISKSLEVPYKTANQFKQQSGFGAGGNVNIVAGYPGAVTHGLITDEKSFNPFYRYEGQTFPAFYAGTQGRNPHYHEENIQSYNYHKQNSAQNINYDQLQNGRIQKYKGESLVHHVGGSNQNINYRTHSSYSGQNVAYKTTTNVQIVPSLGFTLTEDLGRESYVTALLNGLIDGKRTFEAFPVDNIASTKFFPTDVRYSSYQGPSSYLAPQASVQRLPSQSGYSR